MNDSQSLPQRKFLPHGRPLWLFENPVYFITINAHDRGENIFAKEGIAVVIEESLMFRQTKGILFVEYLLLMPDHLHMLISFNDCDMKKEISQWKRFIARKADIKWQRDFFDHRIRSSESLSDKIRYIENNPVRKGLVQKSEDWPYQWYDGMVRK